MDPPLSAFRDWKEWRRMRALRLKQEGWSQRAIAAALGVSPAAVSQWLAAADRDGPDALRSHPAPGRAPG
ncbi:MAG TPA: helix-turn-helix domain-containing protein [Gemmataceae bacterium]|nr:helix-turn-helix domain-containing protein [Gemmataceae bacterium]